jgi:hypothetical protein
MKKIQELTLCTKSSNPTSLVYKKLNPNFVTGFSDGESCYAIHFLKGKSGNYQVQPRFSIELHQRDLLLLIQIQEFFNGIGTITLNNNRNSAVFRVIKLNDITNVIIPHFDKYPLLTNKRADCPSGTGPLRDFII